MNNKTLCIVLIALSVFAGCVGYHVSRYTAATLVIEARTFELGERVVSVTDAETNDVKIVKFVVGDNTGADSFYAVELPSLSIASIKIPPLADNGRFQIDRITIKNADISYLFKSNGECSQKTIRDGKIQREECRADSPVLTVNADQSLTIAAIPASGFENSFAVRILCAFFSCVALLLSGVWLVRPFSGENSASGVQDYLSRAGWLLFLYMYMYQYYQIGTHAVDVPFWEEWEHYFEPNGLVDGLTWKWLFNFWDLHKILFTKLMAWLSWQLNDLNFAVQKIINYLIFGVLLLAIIRFKNKLLGRGEFPLFVLYMIFLLSPIAYANHVVAQMSQTHFVLLFSVLSLHYSIGRDSSIKETILFCLCVIAAMHSYSHGLAFAAVYLGSKTCYTVAGIYRKVVDRKKELSSLLLCYLLIALGLLFWFYGDRKPSDAPFLTPVDSRFWECLFNLVGLGFGFRDEGIFPGMICLFLTLVPCALLFVKSDSRWQVETWQIVTAILGILAALGAICVGRGALMGTSKSSRYAEIAFLLIPYTSMAWWFLLKNRTWRTHFLTLFWLFCFVSYRDDWASSVVYRDLEQLDNHVLECIERYTQGTGDGLCPETRPDPIGKSFDRAKAFGVNFTKQFR